MIRRSGPARFTVPAVGRWVLALLTLVAALAHLTRSPAAGGLGLPLTGLAAPRHTAPEQAAPATVGGRPDHHPTDQHLADHHSADHHPADRHADHATPGRRLHPAGTDPQAGHGLSLTDAAPNAPPTHDHHPDAHCPFCLTAAFALAAAPVVAVAATLQAPSQPTSVPLTLALAVIRHADARAPPTSGTSQPPFPTFR